MDEQFFEWDFYYKNILMGKIVRYYKTRVELTDEPMYIPTVDFIRPNNLRVTFQVGSIIIDYVNHRLVCGE